MNGDLILSNTSFFAGERAASQLAILAGRIIYVGDDRAAARAAAPGATELDLGGRRAIPGLTDSHIHFLWASQSLLELNLDGLESKAAALALVRAKAAETPAGQWIRGHGWNHHVWGGVLPSRYDLDEAAPNNPVLLTRKDGHSHWASSAVLLAAGITRETPDPLGGLILRDEAGEPTGILQENTAQRLVYAVAPDLGNEQAAVALRLGMAEANRRGLTSIHNIEGGQARRIMQALHEAGELNLRVYSLLNKNELEAALDLGLRTGLGDDWFRLGHLKLFADGSLGSLTADMLAPYASDPQRQGVAVMTSAELEDYTLRAAAGGIAVATHAIGDRAVHRALDVFAIARAQEGQTSHQLRHRIEHAQTIDPADQPRFHALNVIASMQPIHATSDYLVADLHLGAERAGAEAYQFRRLLDLGTRLAFGSDCPVETLDPLLGLHAAVTRQRADATPVGGWHPTQRLTVAEAVHAYTLGAAYASGEEASKGSLEVGKLGDVVVLDRDIYAIPAEEIKDVQVLYTIVGGEVKYAH